MWPTYTYERKKEFDLQYMQAPYENFETRTDFPLQLLEIVALVLKL